MLHFTSFDKEQRVMGTAGQGGVGGWGRHRAMLGFQGLGLRK